MPQTLEYTDQALSDLRAIKNWLAQPGAGFVAGRRLIAVWAVMERLTQHPGVRELPCDGGRRALYEITPDTGRDATAGDVRVLRVFGPGQNRGTL